MSDLVDFIACERGWIEIDVACIGLETLGRTGQWPKASRDHWRRDIEAEIANGTLERRGNEVRVKPVIDSKPKQGELF